MKSRIPDKFVIYSSQFTIESMILAISKIAVDIYLSDDNTFSNFAASKEYTVSAWGLEIHNSVLIVQTWLIDLIYDLLTLSSKGTKKIKPDEALFLIHLYCEYVNKKDGIRFENNRYSQEDLFLNVFGFFGEQKRFEEHYKIPEEFSREKYILEVVASEPSLIRKHNIFFTKDFFETTGLTTDIFSATLFAIWTFSSRINPVIDSTKIKDIFACLNVSPNNISHLLEWYSCTFEEIKNSDLKRQILYAKPFIKLKNYYVSANPFLVGCLFSNSNYWIMRDVYHNDKSNSQKFTNAFGDYFENYCKEILENCLPSNSYYKIDECNEPRADWHIILNDYVFLVEQKSGLSNLDIKQTEPNIESMKKHIIKNWGKAVKQLDNTEKALGLNNAVKIILIYEDYYKSECLDLLFENNNDFKELDNKKFWLITINEFEMLFNLYKKDNHLFYEIIKEKDQLETTSSASGRDIEMILKRHNINKNEYLIEYGITEQYNKIIELLSDIH